MPVVEFGGGGAGAGKFKGVSGGGNTDGTIAMISTGTLYLQGGNNITISQDGQSVTIQGETNSGATTFLAGVSNLGNTAGTTGAVNQRLALVGTSNLTLSQSTNGQSATISFIANAPFSAGVSTGGNTAGDTKTLSNRVVLVGGTNITLSQATAAGGGTISIIGADTHAVQTGISGLSASDTVYTSGTVKITGSNMVTVKSGAAQAIVIDATQTLQTSNVHNLTLAGNSTSAGAGYIQVSSGTLTLAGGTNITLSQNGNAVTIVGGAGAGGFQSAGVSSGGNTLGTTGLVSSQVLFVGGDNITLSQSSAAGAATITVIGAAAGTGAGINGISASDTVYTSGTVKFTGSNNITVVSGTGQRVIISGPSGGGAGMGTGTNTSGTSGSVGKQLYFYGNSNIGLSQSVDAGGSSASLTIIGNAGAGGFQSAGVSSGGNTAGTTGLVSQQLLLVGGSNVTLSQSSAAGGATVSIEVQQLTGFVNSISVEGNTLGEVTAGTGRLILAGGNNVTLSGATAAGAMTLTISAAEGGGAGISTLGNTAGTTGIAAAQLILVGGSNVSLSQSLDAGSNSATLTINAGGGGFTAGVSSGGNTDGTTGLVPGQIVFYGGSNVTLSQSINASSATITFNGGGGGAGATFSTWMPPGLGYSSYTPFGQSTLVVFPAQIPQQGVFSRMDLWASVSVSTSSNSSYQGTLSLHAGIYTRNASTLSLATSGSVSYTWNGTGTTSSGSLVGLRDFTVPIAATMTPGPYWVGVLSQSASTNANWVTFSNLGLVGFPNAYSGPFGASTAASNQLVAGLGVFSAQTNAMPPAVGFTDLLASSASTARPVVNFVNYTA